MNDPTQYPAGILAGASALFLWTALRSRPEPTEPIMTIEPTEPTEPIMTTEQVLDAELLHEIRTAPPLDPDAFQDLDDWEADEWEALDRGARWIYRDLQRLDED